MPPKKKQKLDANVIVLDSLIEKTGENEENYVTEVLNENIYEKLYKSGSKFSYEEITYTSIGSIYPHNEKFLDDNQNLFHIGEQIITGVYLEEKNLSLENIHLLVSQDNLEVSNFYLSVIGNFAVKINKPIQIQLECEVFRVLMKLFAERCLTLILKSAEKTENFNYSFTFDVFLTSKLKNENLSLYPVICYTNKHAKDINFLLSSFCYRENSPLKSLSNKFGQNIDNKFYNEDSNTSEFKNAHDSLFELIHSFNKKHNVNNDMEIDLIQEKSCLIPYLRPYQINAVKWMLKKEKFDFSRLDSDWRDENLECDKDSEMHCLYTKLENKNSQVIYFHKYLGYYTYDMPLKAKPILGGVLADEMGLGKTLEVLACILINQRIDYSIKDETQFQFETKHNNSKDELNKSDLFECVCGEEPYIFQKIIQNDSLKEEYDVYECQKCHVWLHSKCVNYFGTRDEFMCLICQMNLPAIPSKCTLIITPYLLGHQWIEEINKQLNKKLNFLFYKGANKGFIQPKTLASLDLCLTTYDVLNVELAHTYATENSRQRRFQRRFMTIPCPLLGVEFWRVCLDEAQMVHSSNSKCAEMANRLKCINRWCITGTPIGKSIGDLQGLFAFLREDPFSEKRWFDELLFRPFINKDQITMAREVSKVLWRNTKNFVEDQIQIPPQTENVYWLNFSPFEVHLYECVREQFKERLAIGFRNTVNRSNKDFKGILDYNPNLRLDELDRQTINNLLAPILNLRITCNHPQLILRRNDFMNQQGGSSVDASDKFLSMEKSLEMLAKKTRTEAENAYRLVATSSNGMAGIRICQSRYEEAIKIYQNLLDSETDKIPYDIRLDRLLLIHTCHNYIEAINLFKRDEKNTICFDEKIHFLHKKLIENEKIYVLELDELKIKSEQRIREKIAENKFFNNRENYFGTILGWLSKVIDTISYSNLFEEFWQKIISEFMVRKEKIDYKMSKNFNSEYELRIYNQNIVSIQELKAILMEELEKVLVTREKTLDELFVFFEKEEKMLIKGSYFSNEDAWNSGITNEIVQQAAQCHLRPESFRDNIIEPTFKCRLCKAKSSFKTYSSYFNLKPNDVIINLNNRRRYQKLDNEELIRSMFHQDYNELSAFGEITIPSDLEKILKHIIWFVKHDPSYKLNSDLVPVAEETQELMGQFSYLKDEQKKLSNFIESVSNQINSYDEIEIAKIRMRIANAFEQEDPNFESLYIIKPEMLDFNYIKHEEEKSENEKRLRKKLNQIIYLKNLEKTYEMKDGEENKDLCPICNEHLGFEWIILSCGHLFCKRCNDRISRLSEKKGNIRCALCREFCLNRDSYIVSTRKNTKESVAIIIPKSKNNPSGKVEPLIESEQAFSDIKINGLCNSAKVEGVVKCLIKILKFNSKAKCVVFSEHFVILDLIISLLHENAINYCCVRGLKGSSQKSIDAFKFDENINVLLMLYSHGANGLNLIEATHVLLVEPTLDKSKELQAINRIHRIGQTKPTFVHRFIIRHTIEEHVYKIFNSSQTVLNSEAVQPMTSETASLLDKSFDSNQNKNFMLTVGDIHLLFKNL